MRSRAPSGWRSFANRLYLLLICAKGAVPTHGLGARQKSQSTMVVFVQPLGSDRLDSRQDFCSLLLIFYLITLYWQSVNWENHVLITIVMDI